MSFVGSVQWSYCVVCFIGSGQLSLYAVINCEGLISSNGLFIDHKCSKYLPAMVHESRYGIESARARWGRRRWFLFLWWRSATLLSSSKAGGLSRWCGRGPYVRAMACHEELPETYAWQLFGAAAKAQFGGQSVGSPALLFLAEYCNEENIHCNSTSVLDMRATLQRSKYFFTV
jgi:hypothetical protein